MKDVKKKAVPRTYSFLEKFYKPDYLWRRHAYRISIAVTGDSGMHGKCLPLACQSPMCLSCAPRGAQIKQNYLHWTDIWQVFTRGWPNQELIFLFRTSCQTLAPISHPFYTKYVFTVDTTSDNCVWQKAGKDCPSLYLFQLKYFSLINPSALRYDLI